MKNKATFATLNILKGGSFRPMISGIFYALSSHIATASLPCPRLMAGLALEVFSSGSVAPFFYSATHQTNIQPLC